MHCAGFVSLVLREVSEISALTSAAVHRGTVCCVDRRSVLTAATQLFCHSVSVNPFAATNLAKFPLR